MARDPKKLRKAYEYKLGKDLVKNLSDTQISELSKYYNSLTADQQSTVDSEIVMGKGEFLNTARSMADPLKYPNNQSVLPAQKNKNEDLSKVDETESKKTPPKKTKKKIDPLDELLKDIRSEKEDTTSSPKLAKRIIEKSQPIQKTKAQKFEADPEAAKVLGIDPFDLTEDEYKTLLKERMIKDRMGQKTDSGEAEIISNEFKRVKRGIQKPIEKGDKVYKSTITPAKLLPKSFFSKLNDKNADTEEVSESVDNMNQTLEGIDSVLKDILGQDKKEDEREKRDAEKSRQASEEKKSEEDSKKKVKKSLSNFKAPKIPFLDRVKDFFKNILIGGAVLKLIKWIQDPKNQETIDNVTNFITNNLDKILLGIAAIIGIDIGGKILGFLGLLSPLIGGLVGLLKGLLGGIVGLLAKIGGAAVAGLTSSIGLGALGLVAGIGGTLAVMKGTYDLTRNFITGGADFSAAHDILDQKLIDAGMDIKGRVGYVNKRGRFIETGDRNKKQDTIFEEVQKERKKLNKLKEDRDKNKDKIEKQKKKDIEELMGDEKYTTEKRTRGGGKEKVLSEEGKKKKMEIIEEAKKGNSREDLLARMATVDVINEPLAQKMEELGLNESQKQYTRWLSLTYGEKGVSEDIIKDTKNIQKFEKDTGISLNSTPPTIIEPQTPLVPQKSTDDETPTAAELTESNEGTGDVPSTPPTQDDMTFDLDVDSTRFIMPEKTKPINPPKPGTPDLSFLPLNMRKKNQALTSGSQAGQKKLTGFSSEDSNNLSIASVRSVYNSIV